jgi:hypothetical protein
MATAPKQSEPAEGPREDERPAEQAAPGVSADRPAEGGDDAPDGGGGSPD